VIDVHTHLHPPKLFAAIRRWFAERSDWDIASQPSEPHDVAAVLRAHGVERFVFCSYATVHLDDPEYVREAFDAFDDGCIGLKLHEDVQRLAVDDPRFAPVFEEMARRNGFLLVHAGPIPWRFDAGAGIARIARVLEAHPNLHVVVAHFGAPDSLGYFELMKHHRHLYLDTTMVFAPGSPMGEGADYPAFAAAIAMHPDRVVYGTDFPNIPYAYDSEARGVAALGLEPAILHAVLRENGARLLEAALHGLH